MKKAINKRVYNTETASLVEVFEQYENRCVEIRTEKLYRKRDGEYFLYRKTNLSVSNTDEVIIPLSREQAMRWIKKRFGEECVALVFGMAV